MTSRSQPEKIVIREATVTDAPDIARTHVDSWRSTYRGIIPDDILDNLSYDQRTEYWITIFQTAASDVFHLVAEDASGQIMGFASAGPYREERSEFRGELYAIYLHPTHQGRGVGSALVREVARRLVQNGMDSMIVWVLAENPARHFYAALGGEPAGEKEITIGIPLREIAFGWSDLSSL